MEALENTNCLDVLMRGASRLQHVLQTHGEMRIATLGPEGTSSAEAGRALTTCSPGGGHCELFPTYEEAAEAVLGGRADYLLVANAYAHINHFYISDRLIVVGAFPFATPPYGVAVDPTRVRLASTSNLASHPAPLHLAEEWFRHSEHKPRFVTMSSTSEAALAVARGEVSACITTEVARKRTGLAFITRTKRIRMLWSVFTRRNHDAASCLFGEDDE
ncbi:hypothetical protein [Archangium sp.]|jgi:hypothetical protein|uniref:hypothetical protein n=1 Tax=Archangium sp. TaxID=1872627 RepID=UPI002ED8D0C0